MELDENFKEHCEMDQKVTVGFGRKLGYRLHPETISPHLADPSPTAHV